MNAKNDVEPQLISVNTQFDEQVVQFERSNGNDADMLKQRLGNSYSL